MSENTTAQTGSNEDPKHSDARTIELYDKQNTVHFTLDGRPIGLDLLVRGAEAIINPQNVQLHQLSKETRVIADHVVMTPSRVAELMYADHNKQNHPIGTQTGLTELPAGAQDQHVAAGKPGRRNAYLGRLHLPAWLHRHTSATQRKRTQQPAGNKHTSSVGVPRALVSILLWWVSMLVASCTIGFTTRYITARATTFSDLHHALGTVTPLQLAIALTLGAIAAACFGPVQTHYTQGWSWRTPFGFLNVLAIGVIKGSGIMLGLVVVIALITGGSVYF